MNTIVSFCVASMIVALGPYENNAVLPTECTVSDEDVEYTTQESHSMLYLKNSSNGVYVSPIHDIPLLMNDGGAFRAVIVTPRQSAKINEILLNESMNPIVNLFASHTAGLQWDCGALTQTWQDGREITKRADSYGPLYVLAFGGRPRATGAVVAVKIVGAYRIKADRWKDGWFEWQIVAIDAKDPKAGAVNSVQDLYGEFPGTSVVAERWLTEWKVDYGQKINEVHLVDAATAAGVVAEKHDHWKELQETDRYVHGVELHNTTLKNRWTLDEFILD